MVKSYKQKLIEHIEGLDNSYGKVVTLLNTDLEKDAEGNVSMKDDKIKIFAEGVLKLAEASDFLLKKIKEKTDELDEINKKPNNKETPRKESGGDHIMNEHLG